MYISINVSYVHVYMYVYEYLHDDLRGKATSRPKQSAKVLSNCLLSVELRWVVRGF